MPIELLQVCVYNFEIIFSTWHTTHYHTTFTLISTKGSFQFRKLLWNDNIQVIRRDPTVEWTIHIFPLTWLSTLIWVHNSAMFALFLENYLGFPLLNLITIDNDIYYHERFVKQWITVNKLMYTKQIIWIRFVNFNIIDNCIFLLLLHNLAVHVIAHRFAGHRFLLHSSLKQQTWHYRGSILYQKVWNLKTFQYGL